jgi:hypothetical protein
MSSAVLEAISLAGFLCPQVMAVLSDHPNFDLTPVAIVITGENRKFIFFDGDTIQAMVGNGRRELSSQKYDAWALAYEGYVTIAGERKNALFIEAWVRGASRPVVLTQALGRGPDGKAVTLVGAPLMLGIEDAPQAQQPKLVDPVVLSEPQSRAFKAGMARNRELRDKGLIGTSSSGK